MDKGLKRTGITYLGPPGTGKTQRNSDLVHKCIEDGIAPDKIANVSFTKRATQESQDRVCLDWGLEADVLPYFQTLHSMAFRTGGYSRNEVISGDDLKDLGDHLGIKFSPPKKNFETDIDRFGFRTEGDKYLNLYSYARSVCKDYEEVFRVNGNHNMQWPVFKRLVSTYQEYKRFHRKIDFTDMIEEFIAMDMCPDIDALLCDEAQDLSTLQWKMISVLRRKPSIQFFFGDDDQAIMDFAGADVAAFQQCTEKKEVLTQSYRVPQAVHEVAESIAKRIEGRLPKVWNPRPYQGFVFEHLDLESIPLHEGEWLFLTRTNYLADRYGKLLSAAGWVYKDRHGNPSIAANVFDAIVHWEAWIRGAKLLPSQIKKIYLYLTKDVGYRDGFSPRSKNFLGMDATVALSIDEARASLGLLAPKEIWKKTLTQIDSKTKQYILSARRRGDTVKNPRITVSTVHSMKGAERDNVVLVPELNWSSYDAYRSNPNPEHRVWYVACTRAKESLHILNPSYSKAYTYPV